MGQMKDKLQDSRTNHMNNYRKWAKHFHSKVRIFFTDWIKKKTHYMLFTRDPLLMWKQIKSKDQDNYTNTN